MIKDILEKLQRELSLKAEFFQAQEKESIQERLLSCMHAHPLLFISKESYYYKGPVSIILEFLLSARMKITAASLAVLITFGASVSYAAQNALPGDSLYGVKTNINEEVRGWLTLSSKQDAQLHVEFAEERMKEIEKLAAKGKIKTETAYGLKENFKKQASAIDAKLGELTNENKHEEALEVSSRFTSSLKAHESVLADLKSQNVEVTDILGSVKEQIDIAEEARYGAERKVKKEVAVEKEAAKTKMTVAKNTLAELSLLIEETEEGNLVKESHGRVKANLKKAKRAYENGRGKYLKKTYSEAFVFFEKANHEAKEAVTYLRVVIELEANKKKETETLVSPSPTLTPVSTLIEPSVSPSPDSISEIPKKEADSDTKNIPSLVPTPTPTMAPETETTAPNLDEKMP